MTPDSDNRATVQLVYRTVDDMGARMDAHFDGIKLRLDLLAPIPGQVAELDKRVTLLEDDGADRRWRYERLISVAALLVAVLALVLSQL